MSFDIRKFTEAAEHLPDEEKSVFRIEMLFNNTYNDNIMLAIYANQFRMSASHMKEIKEILRSSGRDVNAVIDCGMDSEIVCRSTEEIPDDAGYFSLIIAKEAGKQTLPQE